MRMILPNKCMIKKTITTDILILQFNNEYEVELFINQFIRNTELETNCLWTVCCANGFMNGIAFNLDDATRHELTCFA